MKVIFLDIDGVLNDESCWGGRPLATNFAKECVEVLNEIVEATDACVVVSSSRRILYDIDELIEELTSAGINGSIIGVTPSIKGCRGDEIAVWLDNTDENVRSFVILDDDSDMGYLMDHLVQCDPSTGLTKSKAWEAIRMLNK